MARGCNSIYGPVSLLNLTLTQENLRGLFKQCHLGFPAAH
jgi:hypothetical protein